MSLERKAELNRQLLTATADECDAIVAELITIEHRLRNRTARLRQWQREVADGKRTVSAPMDELWADACREAADDEFERTVAAPQRKYVAQLRGDA